MLSGSSVLMGTLLFLSHHAFSLRFEVLIRNKLKYHHAIINKRENSHACLVVELLSFVYFNVT